MGDVLLEIRDLRTYFYTEDGVVKAINGVNLEIASGETLGLVGESGSGKSVTALSILRLIQDPPGKIVSGQVLFKGADLLTYPTTQLRRDIRGREIAMIFQDPMTSLNPVFTVGSQLAEAIYLHQFRGQRAALQQGVDMLRDFARHLRLRVLFAYGGVSLNPQMMALRRGADVLVATPGRLLDLHE